MPKGLYSFPDLGAASLDSRLKRLERTTQFSKRGTIANTGGEFRTVAAWQLDRDGNIIDGAKKPLNVKGPEVGYKGVYPLPSPPVISEQLLFITLGIEFGFNYQSGSEQAPVTGYWVYKNASNDSTLATRWKYYPQSTTLGVQTVQDTLGAGVVFYYWVTAIGPTGESAKAPAQAYSGGGGGGLPSTSVMTTYRPSSYVNGLFYRPSSAYDNNLSLAALGQPHDTDSTSCAWLGFSAVVGTPTSIVLKINWSATGISIGGDADIAKSLNGGSTWTAAASPSPGVDQASTTTSITLPNTQDLTQVQIRADVTGPGLGPTSKTQLNIFEIWIEVVT